MKDTTKIKDTIRKLLAVANNSGATEGEIDNALRFAKQMMVLHHLSEDDLVLDQHNHAQAARKEYADVRSYSFGKKQTSWENSLAGFVMKFFGSVGCFTSPDETKKTKNNTIDFDPKGNTQTRCAFVFYGLEEEVYLANEMFESLAMTIYVLARVKYGTVLKKDGREYADGFVFGLFQKLKEAENQIRLDQATTALIVRSDENASLKLKEAKNWLSERKNIRLSKKSKSFNKTTRNANAFQDGKEDGKNTELGGFSKRPKIS